MKVVIITSYLERTSGWGRYSLAMISQLMENGYEVFVVCNKKNINYKNIEQFAVLPSPLSFKKKYLLSFYYALKFILKNKFNGIDFIHCFVEPYSFFTYLISKVYRKKYFITIHGSYGVKGLDNLFYRFIQLFSYERAKKIICVSNYTKNKLLKYKNLKNIRVIFNGVSDSMFCPSDNNRESYSIIGVGALKNRKGFHLTIKVLNLLKQKFVNIRYYIVGNQHDNEYYSYLKNIIEKNGLKENVIFYENISDEELKGLYKKSKIFILNPISDRFNFEGFGLVYLEANACGLPVIGSYGNGGEDAIKDGYNGFLVNNENVEEIAQKIELLLENNNLYNEMSNNARRWAKELSWNNIIKEYLKVYGHRR